MAESTNPANQWDRDVARVAEELRGRLQARGIDIGDADSPDDIEAVLEAVEEFEAEVEALGGDLMMDEPPAGSKPQPDNPRFLLPKRLADESVSRYISRIEKATAALRR